MAKSVVSDQAAHNETLIWIYAVCSLRRLKRYSPYSYLKPKGERTPLGVGLGGGEEERKGATSLTLVVGVFHYSKESESKSFPLRTALIDERF